MTDHAVLACAALVVEALFGYPSRLFRLVGHPVTWIGRLIAVLDRNLNRPGLAFGTRRALGVLTIAAVLGVVILVAAPVAGLAGGTIGLALSAILSSTFLAQRSLYQHVAAVADALDHDGLAGGRRAVSKIVGRDVAALDEASVARAAIESLAENFSDGVVAPAFWLAVLGLPGIAAYKAINTADSMIGHRSERHAAFGWAAARLDDIVNLPASRLSAVLIATAAALLRLDAAGAVRATLRDAGHHRSPNAGWPEAAMAGALSVALSGPRVYAGVTVEDPFIGGARRAIGADDIRRALSLYLVACAIQLAALALVALIVRG